MKAVTCRIGEIDDHYDVFVSKNDEGKCPYCGLGDIKGVHHSNREAYDHFLPKGRYPFNSVNFHNLAPMCHECNSSYKLQLDSTKHIAPVTRKTGSGRRKAFYSYATVSPRINVTVVLKTRDVENLLPEQVDLQLTSPGHEEQVESWEDVFGIEERYKAKFCAKNDGKYWLQQALNECENAGIDSAKMLQKIQRDAAASPWAEANFLKLSFLNACKDVGII